MLWLDSQGYTASCLECMSQTYKALVRCDACESLRARKGGGRG